ncbi:MAG: hypothetical protein IT461_00780 [Planctomycetes bacterium]|nr:hypothetical protein [Planctomycetota bacterium]
MGKRILIPGLTALLLAAGACAWLVLNSPGQGKGDGGIGSESGTPLPGVTGAAPDATAKAHRQDADATSPQPGSRAGSEGTAGGTDSRPSGSNSRSGQPGGASSARPSSESAGKPAHSKEPPAPSVPAPTPPSRIIDAPRPPNQTLGNARPVSRVIKTPPAKKLEDVSEKLKQDRRGLYAQYYAFQSEPLAELAKADAKALSQRDANLVRIDNQVHFPNNEAFADLPFDLANFAATWDGYLVIPEQGEYWLFLGADNAARVDLDGETVLLNDVQSRYIEVSTVLELAPGLHPLHIEFAQGMLANEDSWRCAASFMYVPKGQQKPVPVPPEMLMVPDWMWSDDAPIITKLSKNEGEIGDEITIYGQGLAEPGQKPLNEEEVAGQLEISEARGLPEVFFNGQKSKLTGLSANEVKARVPIGASTGKLVIARPWFTPKAIANSQGLFYGTIPSNSVDFKVTTQFGLMAQWFELDSSTVELPNRDSASAGLRRIELVPQVDTVHDLGLPFKGKPIACRWEGRLGVPSRETPEETAREFEQVRCLRVFTSGVVRVRIGDKEKSVQVNELERDVEAELLFFVDWGSEHYIPIAIDFLCVEATCTLRLEFSMRFTQGSIPGVQSSWTGFKDAGARLSNLLFPPVTPPKPPRIASVIPMTIAGDEPPTPPFAATPGLVSVREGQQFKCNVEVFGDEEVRAAPITLSIDGHAIECGSGTLIDDSANKRWFRQFVGVVPPGCGEGKLTAKLGLSTSEPFYIDVANKGLIAYLYDLPNPSGYSQFPNILPLTCHTIRKEREINFGTADSFNLPFVAETFAVEWYGAIIIEQDGWYTFTSRTDDGCRVWLNGIEIIDDDNLHAPQEKSSERIKLVAGTYPFRMQFFENNMHEECLLFVAAVDLQEKELLARQVVPKRMFTWEVHDMLPDKVATGKKADGSD